MIITAKGVAKALGSQLGFEIFKYIKANEPVKFSKLLWRYDTSSGLIGYHLRTLRQAGLILQEPLRYNPNIKVYSITYKGKQVYESIKNILLEDIKNL